MFFRVFPTKKYEAVVIFSPDWTNHSLDSFAFRRQRQENSAMFERYPMVAGRILATWIIQAWAEVRPGSYHPVEPKLLKP